MPIISGRDVITQSQSGTGKTAVFCLGALQRIELGIRAPQVLVLSPTRELAEQIPFLQLTFVREADGDGKLLESNLTVLDVATCINSLITQLPVEVQGCDVSLEGSIDSIGPHFVSVSVPGIDTKVRTIISVGTSDFEAKAFSHCRMLLKQDHGRISYRQEPVSGNQTVVIVKPRSGDPGGTMNDVADMVDRRKVSDFRKGDIGFEGHETLGYGVHGMECYSPWSMIEDYVVWDEITVIVSPDVDSAIASVRESAISQHKSNKVLDVT